MRYFLFLLSIGLISCLDSRETKMQRFLIKGNDMAQNSNFMEAKRYYTEAIKLDSCFADAWNNLGTVYFKQEYFSDALESYNQALNCKPELLSARLNRARAFYEMGQTRAALNDLERYTAKSPNEFQPVFLKALILTKATHYDSAIVYFRRAQRIDPANPEVEVNLGTVYYFKGALDSAETILKKAALQFPSETNSLNTLALLEAERKNYDVALEWIEKALRLKNDDPYYLNNRGYIYLLMNDLDKAVKDIDQSIGEDPYNGWAYRNKGIYYLRKNDAPSAIRLLERALKQDTTVTPIYTYLAEAHRMLKDKSKACFYWQDALKHEEISLEQFSQNCPR